VNSKASGKKSSSTTLASTQSKKELVVLDQGEKENELIDHHHHQQHVPMKIPRGVENMKGDHMEETVFGPFSSGANQLNSPVTRSTRSDHRSKPTAISEFPTLNHLGPFRSSQQQQPTIDLAAPQASINLSSPIINSCSYTIEVLFGPYAGQVVPLSTLMKSRISAARGWELQFGRANHCDFSLPLDIYLSET